MLFVGKARRLTLRLETMWPSQAVGDRVGSDFTQLSPEHTLFGQQEGRAWVPQRCHGHKKCNSLYPITMRIFGSPDAFLIKIWTPFLLQPEVVEF